MDIERDLLPALRQRRAVIRVGAIVLILARFFCGERAPHGRESNGPARSNFPIKSKAIR
jgi:hypothetical protein